MSTYIGLLQCLRATRLECALLLNIAEAGTPERTLASDILASTKVYLEAYGLCELCCVTPKPCYCAEPTR